LQLRVLIERHDEVADVDLVPGLHDQRRGDLATIDVRAVRALQVHHDEAVVLEDDARVALRDVALGKDDVVPLDAANRDLVLIEIEGALRSTLLRDDDFEHELL
jgi:hypothetical protein